MTTTAERTLTTTATAVTCFECGLVFSVPSIWQRERVRSRETFWCPNGHPQCYTGETAEQKRIRELERSAKALREQNDQLWTDWQTENKARKQVQRSLSATKGVLTRTKNRVANGVCPCCNRTFANLARHMKGQHPDWTEGQP